MKKINLTLLAAILAASVLMSACGAPAPNVQAPGLEAKAQDIAMLADAVVPDGYQGNAPAALYTEPKLPSQPAAPLTSPQILAMVLEQLGIPNAVATDRDIELEGKVYELEFTANSMEYEIKANAFTGQILRVHTEPEDDRPVKPVTPTEPAVPSEPLVKPTEPAPAANSTLTREDALTLVLNHLGITENDITRLEIKLEKGKFDLEFRSGEFEYEFEVSASSGKILEADKEPIEKPVKPAIPAEPAKPTLTQEDALTLVLNHLGITENDITRLEIKLEKGKFDLEFHSGEFEYEFEVSASSGKILEADKEPIEKPTKPADPVEPAKPALDDIWMVVLEYLGIDENQIKDKEFDFEDGKFELEFKVGNTEYEFEISVTGKILKSEKETDND